MENCTSCQSKMILDVITGENVCSKCGLVSTEETMVTSYFDHEPAQIENGLKYKRFLPSMIDKKNKDAFGKTIKNDHFFNRMRTTEKYSNNTKDQQQNKEINTLERLTHSMQLKQTIVERASYIYQKGKRKNLVQGRSIEGMMLACIYLACQEVHIPFPLEKLDGIGCKYSMKQISKFKKLLITELDLKLQQITPEQYISKISSLIELGGKMERFALNVLRKVQASEIAVGRQPIIVATSVIYHTIKQNNLSITLNKLSEKAGVTTAGLRGFYQIMLTVIFDK